MNQVPFVCINWLTVKAYLNVCEINKWMSSVFLSFLMPYLYFFIFLFFYLVAYSFKFCSLGVPTILSPS